MTYPVYDVVRMGEAFCVMCDNQLVERFATQRKAERFAALCELATTAPATPARRTWSSSAQAMANAAQLRPVFDELSYLSSRKVADELNRRGIPAAAGGRWFSTQVLRVRARLGAAVPESDTTRYSRLTLATISNA